MNVYRGIAANLTGRLWAAVMNFAFVPVYLRILGIEAYGLIGFFTFIIALFLFFDMGFSTAINRELARAVSTERGDRRDILRTFEAFYWPLGAMLALAVFAGAPIIAEHWLTAERLPLSDMVTAVRLMGLTIFFRWPVALYTGALYGLHRQVSLNIALACTTTLQSGGAAVVLWLFSPTIEAFFAWQALAALVQVAVFAALTWSALKSTDQPARPRLDVIRQVFGFSAGVGGITVLSVVLTQFDKAILSRSLTLSDFGTYSLAGTIAATLSIAATSVYNAVFPVLSRLVADGDNDELTARYHVATQIVCLLVAPAALLLVAFAQELLEIFTGDPQIARAAADLMRVLSIGNAFLAFMVLPLALQFAHGWVRLSLYKNLIAVLLYVPSLVVVTDQFGAFGAAVVWLGLTLSYFLIEVPVMHRRLLRSEKWRWYWLDLALPAAVAAIPIGAARILLPTNAPVTLQIAVIGLSGLLSLISAALAAPFVRLMLIDFLKSRCHA